MLSDTQYKCVLIMKQFKSLKINSATMLLSATAFTSSSDKLLCHHRNWNSETEAQNKLNGAKGGEKNESMIKVFMFYEHNITAVLMLLVMWKCTLYWISEKLLFAFYNRRQFHSTFEQIICDQTIHVFISAFSIHVLNCFLKFIS